MRCVYRAADSVAKIDSANGDHSKSEPMMTQLMGGDKADDGASGAGSGAAAAAAEAVPADGRFGAIKATKLMYICRYVTDRCSHVY